MTFVGTHPTLWLGKTYALEFFFCELGKSVWSLDRYHLETKIALLRYKIGLLGTSLEVPFSHTAPFDISSTVRYFPAPFDISQHRSIFHMMPCWGLFSLKPRGWWVQRLCVCGYFCFGWLNSQNLMSKFSQFSTCWSPTGSAANWVL